MACHEHVDCQFEIILVHISIITVILTITTQPRYPFAFDGAPSLLEGDGRKWRKRAETLSMMAVADYGPQPATAAAAATITHPRTHARD